ncbi:MAG: ATP synthase F1 subunit delta [Bdellovibrionales bacterium]
MPQAETSQAASGSHALARRYGGALFDLAEEGNQLDAVAGDLRTVKALIEESAEFRYIANHPRLARAELIGTMRDLAARLNFNKLTANFLALVAQSRRLSCLGAMADAFLAQLASRRGELTADIRTARALTDAQRDRLAAQLRELAGGGKIQMVVREDPGLLGGMTVKLGPHLIDASVKTKLARLERQLKSQEEAA